VKFFVFIFYIASTIIFASSLFQHGIRATFLWPSMSLCFHMFHLTISVLKSTSMLHPKLFTSSTSCTSHADQVRCADLITTQVGLFSFYFWPTSATFEVWILARCRPLLKFGSLSALPVVDPFEFAFTSHLPPSLAAPTNLYLF
jgi:hypothetical protein